MTYRIYLTLMSTITLIAFLAWIVVLFNIDPQDAGLFSSSIFYSSLSIASIGTISVIGTMIRMWIHSDELPVRSVLRSLRQSIWLTLLLIGSLILLAHNLYHWWSVILLILFCSSLELACMSYGRERSA